LALALGFLFWNFQIKRKANKTINDKNLVLEKLNTDLQEANQTKAKLFGIISHDLRSPISQVYQFLKLQELNPNLLDEKQKTDLSGKIQTATGSLLETMEDLLLWSKTQLSRFNTNLELVMIKPVVEQCLDLMKLNIDAKKITINLNIPSDYQLVTDSYFLQIIVRNLLQNAIKASPENSEIFINFENNGEISILNSGSIFTQKDYENILNDPKKQENLSGLGLKLVDELSQKINAKVTFEVLSNHTKVNIFIS
jgi:signal transduction histidine kinase